MIKIFFTYFLPWFSIFLSFYAVYFSYRYSFAKQPLEKQLNDVYLPMFFKLEPFLYNKVEDVGFATLKQISFELNKIIEQNYAYIHPSVVHWVRLFAERLDDPNTPNDQLSDIYNELCYLVDREFEKTRKKMFLPTRNLYYRLNNRQFRTKGEMIRGFIIVLLPPTFVLIIISTLSTLILAWIKNPSL